jgi:hypothetical protein
MNTQVQAVPEGSLLVDCYAPFTPASLQRLKGAVYQGRPVVGVGRYVENLSAEERGAILGAGLGLFTIGVAHKDSMTAPNAGLGSRDGINAVQRLRSLGITPGVTHALDVERIVAPLRAEDVVAYTNAAYAVLRVQTECMFYEGWGIPLSAQDLFHRLAPALYWASSPRSLPPAVRGFAMVQLVEDIELAGVRVDVDEARADALGGTVHWEIAA